MTAADTKINLTKIDQIKPACEHIQFFGPN